MIKKNPQKSVLFLASILVSFASFTSCEQTIDTGFVSTEQTHSDTETTINTEDSEITFTTLEEGKSAVSIITDKTEFAIPEKAPDGNVVTQVTSFRSDTIQKIVLPDTIESIGIKAFGLCKTLTTINIPERVTIIPWGAFAECESLTEIRLSNNVDTIGAEAFYRCKRLSNFVFPANIQTIGRNAFTHCHSFTEVVIPKTLENLGMCAFSGCANLTSVTLTKCATNYDEFGLFWSCDQLSSVSIEPGAGTIAHSIFSDCTSLKNLFIPLGVTMGEEALYATSPDLQIYCEAESQPEEWDDSWLEYGNNNVTWGYHPE